MSRLVSLGFEVGAGVDGSIVGSPAFVTSPVRSGAKALEVQTSTSVAEGTLALAGAVGDRDFFSRFYLQISANPANACYVYEVLGSDFATRCGGIRLETDGTLTLRDKNHAQIGSASLALTAGVWYPIDFRIRSSTTVTNAWQLELRIDGVSIASTTTGAGSTSLSPFIFYIGPGVTAALTTASLYFDDWIINDDQGASQNSWPGGAGKIVWLKPISDFARTGWVAGAGGTTNLWDALDNKPPVGVALASATNTSQVKDANNNTTDTYEANLETYTTAGIGATDTIKVLVPLVSIGNSTSTGRNVGVKQNANPSTAEVVGGTASTAGTYATGWALRAGTVTYDPAGITLGTSPTLRLRKATATTDSVMCCAMGIYVEYDTTAKTQSIRDTATPSDATVKAPQSVLSDSASLSDTQVKAPHPNLSDTAALADAQAQSVGLHKSDTLGLDDAVAKGISLAELTDNASVSDQIVKSFIWVPDDSVSVADDLAKQASAYLVDSVAVADAVQEVIALLLFDTLLVDDTTTHTWQAYQVIADDVTMSDAQTLATRLSKIEAVPILDAPSLFVRKALTDITALADALSKAPHRSLSDALTINDDLVKASRILVVDALALEDAITRAFALHLIETATASDVFAYTFKMGGAIYIYLPEGFELRRERLRRADEFVAKPRTVM